MERDYFKDRPIESTKINCIKKNMEVFICLKSMQKWAEDIEDLHRGYVTEILTKHDHTAGIKVKVRLVSNDMEYVGRVVYIVQDGLILTKDGLKEESKVNPK